MALNERYESSKRKLLEDKAINKKNRILFKKFLVYEEYKLKRKNSLITLDDNSYKTLLAYVTRLRVVNRWFKNKDWKKLSKNDIKHVYNALLKKYKFISLSVYSMVIPYYAKFLYSNT